MRLRPRTWSFLDPRIAERCLRAIRGGSPAEVRRVCGGRKTGGDVPTSSTLFLVDVIVAAPSRPATRLPGAKGPGGHGQLTLPAALYRVMQEAARSLGVPISELALELLRPMTGGFAAAPVLAPSSATRVGVDAAVRVMAGAAKLLENPRLLDTMAPPPYRVYSFIPVPGWLLEMLEEWARERGLRVEEAAGYLLWLGGRETRVGTTYPRPAWPVCRVCAAARLLNHVREKIKTDGRPQ